MNMFRHIASQPFIVSTGLAALFHSTWALATLFTGKEPYPQFTGEWFAWVVPAALIAFALDVGQVVTSAEIRAGHKKTAKYVTFAVFALATYFLQWLYMIHHIPALELSEGVRDEWAFIVTLFRDCAIWVIPALLPLSTLLYTFSTDHAHTDSNSPSIEMKKQIIIEQPHENIPLIEQTTISDEHIHDELVTDNVTDEQIQITPIVMPITVVCDKCGWTRTYTSELSAQRGLAGHKCKANDYIVKQNGYHAEVVE